MSDKVFLDYTQEELDRAYEQRVWAANREEVVARYGLQSEAVRRRHRHFDLAYGPTPDETLEVVPAAGPKAPVHLYVHGGRWLAPTYDGTISAAAPFAAAGVTFVGARFATLPKVRLPEMVDQLRRAVVWLYRNAASFGGDPDRLFISGHSSGGHLAAVLLTTDWQALGVPADVVKGGLCLSGMYDLTPVMLSFRSAYVKLTSDEVHALSPIHHVDRVRCPIIVAYGDQESPEFQRHGREFAAALAGAGHAVDTMVLAGRNHFEAIEVLGEADAPLCRAVLRQMGVARA
jgi:arylformamidase